MRSEKTMLDLIMNTARSDDRIRAVIMNGSRTNPAVPRDIFQDYDIVYIVTDVASFTSDPTWIDRFGERMILQTPNTMGDPPPDDENSFTYLIEFMDGNRIDLNLYPVNMLHVREEESLRVLLLDKDGLFEPFPPSDDRDHLPRPPSAQAFGDCCNEFWWVSTYVAKGLWREELTYAKYMMDNVVRDQLMNMLTWYVGLTSGYTRGPGKYGKYLRQTLAPELWAMLEKTFADADTEKTWAALLTMGELFRKVAVEIAVQLDFEYPIKDDERVTAHLNYVRALPHDATDMY